MKLKRKNKLIALIYSAISLITVLICLVSNYIISHTFTWSLIALFSLLLLYLILMPCFLLPKSKKLISSLISLTIFIFPYFLILSFILSNFDIFKIGSVSSLIILLYLWGTYIVYKKLAGHGFKGAAIELLITAFFSLSINLVLSFMLSTNTLNISNILCIIILFIFSIICFIYDYKSNK